MGWIRKKFGGLAGLVFLDGKLTLYKREPSLTEKTLIIVPFRLAVNTRLPQSECGESAQTRMFLKYLLISGYSAISL
jgi:hypothetical protein